MWSTPVPPTSSGSLPARAHELKSADDEISGRLLESTPDAAPPELAALDGALASAVARHEGRAWEADVRSLQARAVQLGRDLAEILKPAPATARTTPAPNVRWRTRSPAT